MSRRAARLVHGLAGLILGGVLMACAGGHGGSGQQQVRVSARTFSGNTAHARYYVSGDGLAAWSIGTRVDIDGPIFPTTLFGLPEGRKTIQAAGYNSFAPGSPNPPEFPFELWRGTGHGTGVLTVTPGALAHLVIQVTGAGSDNFGVAREVLDGNYPFREDGQYAGSGDDSNLTLVAVDGANPLATVTLGLTGDGFGGAPAIGLFGALPDTLNDPFATWPAPETWATTLDLITDSTGDAFAWLVATPGSSGRLADLQASGAGLAGNDVMLIRVAGIGVVVVGTE